MGAHPFQFLGHPDIILERVFVPALVQDVAGVADGRLANGVRVLDGFHRHPEVRQVVERVEDAEDIHAGGGGVLDEPGDHVVGVVGVTDGVRAAEEHLEADVGDGRAKLAQPFPRVFGQEPHGGVEGGAAPHFQGEQAAVQRAQPVGERRRAGQHVVGAQARGHERLVGVAEGGVGDEQALSLARPLRELLRPEFQQQVARALGDGGLGVVSRRPGGLEDLARPVALGVRVAVDDDVAQEVQQLGGPVAARFEVVQLRGVVDQGGGGAAFGEDRVVDDVLEEGNVGLDAANAEFPQGPVHAVARQVPRHARKPMTFTSRES